LTVNADSVPFPETVRASSASLWQYRQIGAGGWMSDWHFWHLRMRSWPSAPAVQKYSFSAVT
jgi:hypothetical protein